MKHALSVALWAVIGYLAAMALVEFIRVVAEAAATNACR